MIPNDGKASLFFGYGFYEVKALLSGSCHKCLDRFSTKEGNEQIGSHRMTNPMGHRT